MMINIIYRVYEERNMCARSAFEHLFASNSMRLFWVLWWKRVGKNAVGVCVCLFACWFFLFYLPTNSHFSRTVFHLCAHCATQIWMQKSKLFHRFWCLNQLVIKMVFVFICFSHSSYLFLSRLKYHINSSCTYAYNLSGISLHALHINHACYWHFAKIVIHTYTLHGNGKYSIFRMDVLCAVYISICLGDA